MIPDKNFKKLNHYCQGYTKHSNGSSLELGYKPDFVLISENDFIILESENSSSRKTFVGGMIKAAHFLQKDKTGILIFLIVPKKNTTASSIAKHIDKYFQWIKTKTNLREIFVMEADIYCINDRTLEIGSKDFLLQSFQLK